jgi:hypothetical protein
VISAFIDAEVAVTARKLDTAVCRPISATK